jgi:hypothetical protein
MEEIEAVDEEHHSGHKRKTQLHLEAGASATVSRSAGIIQT